MFALDAAGPRGEVTAGFLRQKLHEQIDRRSNPRSRPAGPTPVRPDLGERALRAGYAALCVSLGSRERIAAFETLRRSEAFDALALRNKQVLMRAVAEGGSEPGQLEAALEIIQGAGFIALPPRLQSRFLEGLGRLHRYPERRRLLARAATLAQLGNLSPALQLRVLEVILGPLPRRWSDPDHARELGRWWTRRRREVSELLDLLETADSTAAAAEVVLCFLDEPGDDLWLLSAPRLPGAYLICFGAPSDRGSLAYVRLVSLDAEGRMAVRVKSPVEPVRQGWSHRVDPEGVAWEFRRFTLSRREELGLIRWVEDNHRIEGARPGDTATPVAPAGLHESALQLDLRLPRMVEVLTAHRGPISPTSGEMVRGQPLREAQAKVA